MSVGRFAIPTVAPTAPSGIAYSFGRILHSGQTNVSTAGDEGTMLTDGFFDYAPPVYPAGFAKLSDFNTLVSNNKYGNATRFTDRAGSEATTTGNRWVQDHLTGIEFYILGTLPTAVNHATAVAAAYAATIDGETDLYLPNEKIFEMVMNYSLASPLNHGAFAGLAGTSLWTATEVPGDATRARIYNGSSNLVTNSLKSATCSYIYCRKFIND